MLLAAETKSHTRDVLKELRTGHPKLLATKADFAALHSRVEADQSLREQHKKLRESAEQLLKAVPSKYEIPDGLRLLATSRQVLNRMMLLGYMYQMEGGRPYVERAWKELEAAAHFPDWNPRHFLDTAEMTHAFAIGYDWMYDAWTPEQRQVLTNAIIQMGVNKALPLYREHKAWTVNHFNWNQVCNGGIGMGALAIADEQPELAKEIINATVGSLPLAMSEFAPDGAWKEGPGYWNYATIYNVVYLAALDSALGSDFGLSSLPGFSEAGSFPIYTASPLGRTFNYADAHDREGHAPQLFWLGTKFRQPAYSAFAEDGAQFGPWDMIWYREHTSGDALNRLPLDKHFRNAEIATFRGSWTNKNAAFLGFKCGDNKAGHSHLDLGSFIYDADGVRWACDLGPDDYNLPAYFGRSRWEYYRLRTEGHNTLVINPNTEGGQGPAAKVTIARFVSKPERAFAICDLAPAYATNAQKLSRGVYLYERRDLLVQDEFKLKKPGEIWWFMHTAAEIKVNENPAEAILQLSGKRLRARILSPANANFEVMTAEPLPGSPHPAKQAVNTGIRKLAVHLKDADRGTLVVWLSPQGEDAVSKAPKVRPLSDW
jgi:hypothetical protein